MVHKIKQHRRKNLKTNFNLFMHLINEVISKLYFPVNNVLLMGDNRTDLTDIYKTVRRKYNIHDVLSKVQNLTQKKDVYEHYRAYLLYKYKTTYSVCDELFKTHQMGDNINIFNFKNFYNTDFGGDKFSVIRAGEGDEQEEGADGANGEEKADGVDGMGGAEAPAEETPLERAKRIAREKKQKLMESRIKII
ncbi:hypothetical protein PCYB_061550 [Plasmodium cynomolgi strain B]|uniref:Uncharacterized protein n=1 Tax=Plasmodium cynomolgi (strain B) TaxID=1120755 RepID=K6UIX5_PLACD|nr:hypothetical protein PCYB_061550 [Plasmodium cynomolgi strain B]GAB65423.1 hypothetical protein PCYB_061550 [Plasmodium cynomolgi strain B]